MARPLVEELFFAASLSCNDLLIFPAVEGVQDQREQDWSVDVHQEEWGGRQSPRRGQERQGHWVPW